MFISYKYMTKNTRSLFILIFLTPRVGWNSELWKFNQSPTHTSPSSQHVVQVERSRC